MGPNSYAPLLRLRPDRMDPTATPEIVAEGPGWAMVDGHYAIAMVSSCMAMETAIAKAKHAGIGYAGVRNSNHFGAAGYYTVMAAKQGMIGLSMTNTNPLVTVPGSRTAVIGTNPFSFAVPAGEEHPVFLDIATSVVAASKVITAKALGKKIPNDWIVDGDGTPTSDPNGYPEQGALLPMAGHKGYGLALLIEIIGAVLTGADTLSDVTLWLEEHPGPLNQGHAFIAIDVNAMMPIDQFKKRMDRLIREIKSAPKAKGAERIYLPGEKEWEYRERVLAEGLLLPPDAIERLAGLAEDFGMEMSEYL